MHTYGKKIKIHILTYIPAGYINPSFLYKRYIKKGIRGYKVYRIRYTRYIRKGRESGGIRPSKVYETLRVFEVSESCKFLNSDVSRCEGGAGVTMSPECIINQMCMMLYIKKILTSRATFCFFYIFDLVKTAFAIFP